MNDSSIDSLAEPCPEFVLLQKAAEGDLFDYELDQISDHINNCEICLAKLESLISQQNKDDFARPIHRSHAKNLSKQAAFDHKARWSLFPELGERFEVIRKLGSGGMGEVFECFDHQLNRTVAVKKIKPEMLKPDLMQRLNREARIQCGLNHPNIVQIYEVGQLAGIPFLAMELVGNVSLRESLGQSPLPPRLAAILTLQIARAISFAHSHHVLHRDIKPANALLTPAFAEFISLPNYVQNQKIPDQPLIKLADFGLAKIFNETSHLTKSDVVVGTPAYLSPEQVSSEKKTLTPASDIYSLGVVLYESLIGHTPFNSHALNITMAMIESMSPVSPRINRPEIPRDLETICLKCLEKEPEKRYRSALELAEDLERFLNGHPIVARPLNKFQQFYRWCHRNRSTAAASFTAIISLVFLATGSFFYAKSQARLHQIAQVEAEKSKLAENSARKAEKAAIEAEKLARKESDFARNSLFSGLYGMAEINKQFASLDQNQAENARKREISQKIQEMITSKIKIYLQRYELFQVTDGPTIERLFSDAVAMRDFGETDIALGLFQKIIEVGRQASPNQPDYYRLIAAATRSASLTGQYYLNQNQSAKALSILQDAWNRWSFEPTRAGVNDKMLYDRQMLGEFYAKALRESGNLLDAIEIDQQVQTLIGQRAVLFGAK
jgi:serine/threonine protein kinase